MRGARVRAAAPLLWLGVFGGLLLAMLGQSLHFGHKVRTGRIVTDSDTLDLLEKCRATLRVSPFLALVETDGVRSPALLGCIRPKLLLTCGFLDTLSREEMRHIFLHEVAHVKRGDLWSGWLFNLLLAAHWFNPAGALLAQSQIPTLIEWPDRHAVAPGKRGGNVLFMDSHVEFITYPGKWPMTEETIGILCKLARREPIKKLE